MVERHRGHERLPQQSLGLLQYITQFARSKYGVALGLVLLVAGATTLYRGCSGPDTSQGINNTNTLSPKERVDAALKALREMGATITWKHPEGGPTDDPMLVLGTCHANPVGEYENEQHIKASHQEFLGRLAAADAGVQNIVLDGLVVGKKMEMAATGVVWTGDHQFQLFPYPFNKQLRDPRLLDPAFREKVPLTLNGKAARFASPKKCTDEMRSYDVWKEYITRYSGKVRGALPDMAFTACRPDCDILGAEDPEEDIRTLLAAIKHRSGFASDFVAHRSRLPKNYRFTLLRDGDNTAVKLGNRVYPYAILMESLQSILKLHPEEQSIHRKRERYAVSRKGDMYATGFDHIEGMKGNTFDRSIALVTLPESERYMRERGGDVDDAEIKRWYDELSLLKKK